VQEGDVGTVEQDVGRDVRRLDLLAEERHVHDAERRHGALVGQLHLVGGGDAVHRARTARRDVDLLARGAALAEQPALGESAEERRLLGRGGVVVGEVHRRDDSRDALTVRGLRLRRRVAVDRLEVLDVGDRADGLVGPVDAHAEAGLDLVG
jgi:hypothetical protein